MRNTKIICTLGPASSDYETIKAMVEAGMDIARLNFSHGDHETHQKNIHLIREVAAELNRPIAILQDLQGPKIRVGDMEEGVILRAGEKTCVTMAPVLGNAERFSSTYKDLSSDVREGEPILINDGLIRIKVDRVTKNEIYGTVIQGGPLKSHKGINLSYSSISTPALTEKDIHDLTFGLSQDIDYVALSFVREDADIKEVRGSVRRKEKMTQVIAKIERHEAVEDLESIVDAADALMVARGDLGVELPLEQVPLIQKSMIQSCRRHLKPVITATQMLESMIQNPTPTRAEVSDVANAIFDGTDAIMLSGETAVGAYPVDAVRTMARIAETVEANLISSPQYIETVREHGIANSVAHAACQLAEHINAKAIICFTEHGFTARLLSKYRQSIPVIAITREEHVQRQMALYWGVQSLRLEVGDNTDEMIAAMEKAAVENGFVSLGDIVVITAGLPLPLSGVTNLIKAHRIGENTGL
ncbi:pyruvate kinase [Planktothrix sp. FACHB-1355]|uniref:Pyruvate kinase n=1 Tax=Aerosakkonema funiforme FACHB-1375 TaxID=2949571 RepID=A0A926ZI00_9CYAN|nr:MULTISPECIES: pyruvate kinase [Oscillatoriales]MBD2183174.1 pyruvate kinase [Aerosakkonema funiforme FACHB-1375]MBD3560078.1 pyruvate kinase [Planktothrix sp. FACHB-1355]